MSTPAAPAAAGAKPKKSKKLLWIIVCLLGIGGGAATPLLMGGQKEDKAAKKKKEADKTASVPFGDAVCNLAEDRMQRYLKVKIVLLVDAEKEKEATEHIAKHKAAMKSWLISHLSGKSLKDVSGTVGVKRLQREILERFEAILYPDEDGHLRDVLFEEYVVQ